MNKTVLLLIITLFTACNSKVKPPTASLIKPMEQLDAYCIDVISDKPFLYSGYANFDEFKKLYPGQMAYSGYDAASFLVSILAHAAISKGVDSKHMNNFLASADQKALAHCKDYLAEFNVSQIEEAFIEHHDINSQSTSISIVSEHSELERPLKYITSKPQFILSQEGDSLLIENEITLSKERHSKTTQKTKSPKTSTKRRNKPANTPKKLMIVVLSDKHHKDALMDNEALKLKELSKQLFIDSMSLGLKQLISSEPLKTKKYKTVKYHIGDHFRVERGEIISSTCKRTIFKSLRGWIKSVPTASTCGKVKL